MNQPKYIRLYILTVLVSSLIYLMIIYYGSIADFNRSGHVRSGDLKYILFWNNYFIFENFGFGPGEGRDIFLNNGCPVNTCYATSKRDLLPVEDFDALMFHTFDFTTQPFILLFRQYTPRTRSSHQRYIFFLLEPPSYDWQYCEHCDNFFNWTMTYRLDSDIPHPYGYIVPLNASFLTPLTKSQTWMQPQFEKSDFISQVIANKTKLVAWLVSNCYSQSKRENYAKSLSKYISMDVYGDCGELNWPKEDYTGFFTMLSANYKFYLSFENSICNDYVTEKLFKTMNYYVVPIVYGGAEYTTVAPPMSYIDVRDFETPHKLAEYLLFLDRNPEEYAKFFWWKNHYKVLLDSHQSLCRLCEMLHEGRPDKSYTDLDQWWDATSDCQRQLTYS